MNPASRLVGGLATGQIVGWGGTYFMPPVLGAAQERALGLPEGSAAIGITLMLSLSALLAPRVGRLIAAQGARPVMTAGSVVMAAGMATMAAATSWPIFVLAWAVLGLAAPLCLSEPANAAIVQAGPAEARRRIGILSLMTGMTATLAWPALAWLEAEFGWRGALLATAAANLGCAVLHWWVAPPGAAAVGAGPPAPLRWTPCLRWLAAAFTLSVIVTSGVSIYLIALLESSGLTRAGAVAMAALFGPIQVAARALEMTAGRHRSALSTALLAMSLLPPAFLVALLPGWLPALALVTLYAVGGGLVALMRPSCVLELSGPAGYPAVQGRVMGWVTFGMAAAPSLFAPLLALGGPRATLLACAAGSLASLVLLRGAIRRAPTG
ncbi:MFS transporter [Muricoccus radiodurans]|uniref:MFS transporter n=1 Tax=Muricoccus radiodurans TaxID=2231721 RepID=UPI003CE8D993